MTRPGLCASLAAAVAVAFAGTAESQNLIPDPAFSAGVDAWAPINVGGGFSMTFAPGFSKRPGSGSALLSFDGAGHGAYVACVPVLAGQPYEWGFSYFYPDASRTIGFNETLSMFAGPQCTGAHVGGWLLTIVPQAVGAWAGPTTLVTAPPGCQSILVGFTAFSVGGARPFAYFDDVFFALAGTVPPIDPPAPAPALSTLSLLALGGSLALAAARLLRA